MIVSRPGLVLIRGIDAFLAHFRGPLKYPNRASFPALVMRLGLGFPGNYPNYRVFTPLPGHVDSNQENYHKILILPKVSLT